MKQQLAQYVTLLFAGAPDSEDIRQEILQNTLDRYDDLIDQGKSPEAAYRLAISGIGDINEILGRPQEQPSSVSAAVPSLKSEKTHFESNIKTIFRAIAIGLYIISPLPVIVLGELGMGTLGISGMFAIIAVATVMIILCKKPRAVLGDEKMTPISPKQELQKSINSLIWTIGLVVYFVVSLFTMAWYITWVIFPLLGAIEGLIKACFDLKEAN